MHYSCYQKQFIEVEDHRIYIYAKLYEYSSCRTHGISNMDTLTNTIITILFGVWLPMILIALVYILMYLRIKQQATQRELNSSHDSRAQMVQILRTFTIVVLVYYVCYLPSYILDVIYTYSLHVTEVISGDTYNRVLPITNFLLFCNSCLNPIIYSKIHMKIYNGIKDRIAPCNLNLSGNFNWCRQRNRQQPSTPEANSYEMFVIPMNERNNHNHPSYSRTRDLNKLHENLNNDLYSTCTTSR